MSYVEKYLRVSMPDRSKWDVPCSIIAKSYAEYYDERDADTTYQEEFDFVIKDNYELMDWASNNMDWEDVEGWAIKVEESEDRNPIYRKGWINGHKEILAVDSPE